MSHDGRSVGRGLDESSASASKIAVAGVVAVLSVAVALSAGAVPEVLLGTVSAVVLAGAIGWVNDDRPSRVAGGSVAGLVAAVGIGLSLVSVDTAPLVLAISVAVFGASVAVLDAGRDRRIRGAVGMLTYAVVTAWVVSFAVVMTPAVESLASWALSAFVPANAGPDLFGFAALVTLAVVSVRSALRGLPIAELAPKRDRDRVEGLVDQAESALTRALWIAAGGLVVGLVLAVALFFVDLPRIVEVAISIPAGTPILRGPLFAVFVVAGTTAVGVRLARYLGASVLERSRRAAAAGGGLAFALGVIAVHPALVTAVVRATGWVPATDPFVVLVGLLAVVDTLLVMVLLALLAVPVSVGLRLVPGRAVGVAIAATGLVGTAVAVASTHPLLVIGSVVGALVVWDLGEFAVGLGEEVGGNRDTGRVEAVHVAGSLGVGLVAAAVASGAYGVVQVLNASGRVALVALGAAVVGVFLLAATLRG